LVKFQASSPVVGSLLIPYGEILFPLDLSSNYSYLIYKSLLSMAFDYF
jgi:hypothetical protein